MERIGEKRRHQATMEWARTLAKKFGWSIDTILGIYDEMYEKYRALAKEQTILFISSYLEGKNEGGQNARTY